MADKLDTPFRNARLLLIDQQNDNWPVLNQALHAQFSDASFVRVDSPARAKLLLDEWRYQDWELPCLILLDLYLPNPDDGIALVEHIKAMGAPVGWIPLVMMSTSTHTTDIARAYQTGISSYIFRPIKLVDWLTCLAGLRAYWWETATLPTLKGEA